MAPPPVPFVVHATKKGSMPFARVKTKYGKTHTRIDNCRGDVALLLSTLTRALGCGGSVCEDKRSVVIAFDESFDRIVKVLKSFDARCVRGLRDDEANANVSSATTTSAPKQEARSKPRHGAAGSEKRANSDPSSVAPIVITKRGAHESARRSVDAYKALLRRWPYWDGDNSRLFEMYHRYRRLDNDVVMSLDADSNVPSGATETASANDDDRASTCTSTEVALRALGMLATPSEFRQSRLERQRHAAKRKEADVCLSNTRRNSSAIMDMDPFAEYLQRERGFAPARQDSVAPPRASTSTRTPVARRTKAARRPTGSSYTNARKQGASTSVAKFAYRESNNISSSDDDDVAPTRRRDDFVVGFTRDARGKFTFGGEERPQTQSESRDQVARNQNVVADFRADVARWPRPQAQTYDCHAEDRQLAEAMRLSKLEFEKHARQRDSARTMHVECDELFGDMTEEEIIALVVRASREDAEIEIDAADLPTRTEWVHARLGEMFFPDVDRARHVAEMLEATETDRCATMDLLIGAGAARGDAEAFWELLDALTLTDKAERD